MDEKYGCIDRFKLIVAGTKVRDGIRVAQFRHNDDRLKLNMY